VSWDVGDALIVTKTPVARLGVAMATGRLRCSGCQGKLRPWGYARRRWIRDRARYLRFRPRRVRCQECRRTHVVLPDRSLLRRLDRVEVIGAALTASASGVGTRTISRRLQLPRSTVRGWIRRFAARSRGAPGLPVSSDAQPAMINSADTTSTLSPGARWRRISRESNGLFLT
jgi:transposase-like protein